MSQINHSNQNNNSSDQMDMNSLIDEMLFENNTNNNQNTENNNSGQEQNANSNINPLILNNNNSINNNEENKDKIDIIIELQKKLLEEMTKSNFIQGKLIEEIKEIRINQGTTNIAIELLLNELKSYKEKEKNQAQEKNDDKEKIQDKEQKNNNIYYLNIIY